MKKIIFLILPLLISFMLFSACSSGSKNKTDNSGDTTKKEMTKTTKENLIAAVNQEVILDAKYSAYAIKAKEEGYTAIQRLFEAVSNATLIHISNLTNALEKMGGKATETKPIVETKTTKENLEESIKNESDLKKGTFPQYIELADKEGLDDASIAFTWANDTKKRYSDMFNSALDALNKNTLNKLSATYYVCPRCGNIFDLSNVEDECSYCGTGKAKFIIFK